MNIIYKIDFFSDWHTGSGTSSGSDMDSLVLKDSNNLPYIPGKTIKGLIRDAAETIAEYNKKSLSTDFIKDVFGKRSNPEKESSEKESSAGNAFFSNAIICDDIEKSDTPFLYRKIVSTKIDAQTGTTLDHSLRSQEVCIPVTLYGEILALDEKHLEALNLSLKMVKRLGVNRNRGLGRCQFSIISQ